MFYGDGVARYYGETDGYRRSLVGYGAGVASYEHHGPFGSRYVQDPNAPRGEKHWVISTSEEVQRWGCPIGTPLVACPGYLDNPDAPPVQPRLDAVEVRPNIPVWVVEPLPPMVITSFELPKQETAQERPGWQTPALIGGGILALSGLAYILLKSRRGKR